MLKLLLTLVRVDSLQNSGAVQNPAQHEYRPPPPPPSVGTDDDEVFADCAHATSEEGSDCLFQSSLIASSEDDDAFEEIVG